MILNHVVGCIMELPKQCGKTTAMNYMMQCQGMSAEAFYKTHMGVPFKMKPKKEPEHDGNHSLKGNNTSLTSYGNMVIRHPKGKKTKELVRDLCEYTRVYPRPEAEPVMDELISKCCDYIKTQGWTMRHAIDKWPGELGDYEFYKPYIDKRWVGHGVSTISLTGLMADAARKRYPNGSRPKVMCPDCVIEYCKRYKMDMLSPYVRTCVSNARLK
jgi:nucleoside diphosphate kinase